MADSNSTDLPAGVRLEHDYSNQQVFVANESAFVSAGWIRPEWLAGLGRYARQIALDPQGGFSIIHEGKGFRLTHQHLEAGAVSVRRLDDGQMQFTKYKTMTERRERERVRHEEYEREEAGRKREAEARAWAKAKQAREEDKDFATRWKKELARRIDELARLIDGRTVFSDFPDIKLPAHDLARMKSAFDYLRHEFDAAKPIINDIEAVDNVISLRANAHSRLKNASR